MIQIKALSLCATVAASIVALSGAGSAASGKGRPILIQAAPEEMVMRHVSYADLDLAGPAGARTLMSRVSYAVQDLCGEVAGSGDRSFTTTLAISRCSRTSWEQARPQVDLAMQRAREIALTGKSSITAAALVISAPASK